jgi:hypothetical protein
VVFGESVVLTLVDPAIVEQRSETQAMAKWAVQTVMEPTQVFDGELAVFPCLVEAVV